MNLSKNLKVGTKVAWYEWVEKKRWHRVQGRTYPDVYVSTGIIIGRSRQGDSAFVVEWDFEEEGYPVTVENAHDLVEM